MTTVLEIEKAIERLPDHDRLKLAEWFEEHCLVTESSGVLASSYDEEDGGDSQLEGE